ncbi:MAG TPA: calcium/sodium antiporter [Spirochaetota bacterium]|nr:calcium/sodium antiporter [Spirochaetota bacterium]HPJ34016.1 calcium/sodium antiporter [Spirochaetota bacterium]
MISFVFLCGGLAAIIFSAGWLVDGASSLAKRFGISDMVIGLTIVAFGTSAPELTVNIFSAVKGSTDIAIGNIIGSNISNILLILGTTSLIYPLAINNNTKWKEIPLSLLAAVVLLVMANDIAVNNDVSGDFLSRGDGIILLCFMMIFFSYTYILAMKGEVAQDEHVKNLPVWRSTLFVLAGIIGLFVGGKYLVEGAVDIAKMIGISERVIGLTIVAVGTSLPELATSAVAAYRRKTDIAVGNVIGSNIFNIFLVLGITSVINPLPFNNTINLDIAVCIVASLILFLTTFTFKRSYIDRGEGGFFLVLYFSYIIYLII